MYPANFNNNNPVFNSYKTQIADLNKAYQDQLKHIQDSVRQEEARLRGVMSGQTPPTTPTTETAPTVTPVAATIPTVTPTTTNEIPLNTQMIAQMLTEMTEIKNLLTKLIPTNEVVEESVVEKVVEEKSIETIDSKAVVKTVPKTTPQKVVEPSK